MTTETSDQVREGTVKTVLGPWNHDTLVRPYDLTHKEMNNLRSQET